MPDSSGKPTLAELLAADNAKSSGGGGSGRAPDTGQIIRDPYDGNYYRVMDNGDIIPIDIPGKTDAPAFDNYGNAAYTGIDGPRGAVYRASNGDYVYGDQVFKSWSELKSLLDTSSPDAADTSKFKMGNDGLPYQLGADGQFHLVPGMPADIAKRDTQIRNIGGFDTLVDMTTGATIKVLGPSGSPSSSNGGSGGSSSGGLISGRSPGVNTGTGSIVSSSSGYDQLAAQQAQRDWQGQQSALDRAQRAAEFAQTFGLQAANYQLSVRDRADAAAKTYGELVSSADTAALPAYLAAGGGNLFNALSTGNSMLTDNAIKPGAMALDNARYYQGLLGAGGGTTGGNAMPGNPDPFNPNSPPAITPTAPPADGPLTGGTDQVVTGPVDGSWGGRGGGGGQWSGQRNGGGNVVMGRERGGGLGGGAYGAVSGTGGGRGNMPRYNVFPSYNTNPGGMSAADAATAFEGYAQAQQMQYDQNNPEAWNQTFPTLTPGSTYWQGGQLYYNTPNGPLSASMIDPYTMAQGMQAGGSPYNSNAWLPAAQQQQVATDPRSMNPNLNLPLQAQNTRYVRPTPVAPSAPTPLHGWTGTLPSGQRVVNGVPAGPASVAPNVARFASGGMIRGFGMVGDSPSGRHNGHEELVFAPQGAMVFPLNKVAHHARGGAIDPFAPAGSSDTPATDPQSAPTGGYTTMPIEPAAPVPAAPTPPGGYEGALYMPTRYGYGATAPAAASPSPAPAQSPVQQAANPQPSASSTPTTTTGNGYNIVNGPNYVAPGTPVPTGLSEAEVRAWRENFPIPTLYGPNGALNPFDVEWQNQSPLARSIVYNANQTRFGIPAEQQQWEQQRFALPGAQRGGWGY